MAHRFNLSGKLIVQNNTLKPIPCQVELKIERIDWEESKDSRSYLGGVRVTGELSYCDENPPKIALSPGLGSNNDLRLTVFDRANGLPESIYSEFNIVLFEKMGSVDRGRDRLYFWQFTNLGPILTDHLNLFPADYKPSIGNKVFLCRDFRGEWPYPVSAVIVAENRYSAGIMLKKLLEAKGIPFVGNDGFTLTEIDLAASSATLIQDGN